jgi:hypothetical protein
MSNSDELPDNPFAAPEAIKQRAAELIRREKNCTLSAAQKGEMDHLMEAEHQMRMLKARWRGGSSEG